MQFAVWGWVAEGAPPTQNKTEHAQVVDLVHAFLQLLQRLVEYSEQSLYNGSKLVYSDNMGACK